MARRTLIVGDVHGCADELRALYELARADRVVCVGDLFTKGPDPVGVWRQLQDWGALAVRGNHETALLQDPARALRRGLPQAALDWMGLLPSVIELEELGVVVVHGGLHPELGVEGTDRRLATTLRRWPDDRDPAAPFWWQLYQGPELVVYGHDAVRSLQDHRPRTLGLDTGCVYGGRLTGYVPEDDVLVSVPAARVYKRPAGGR